MSRIFISYSRGDVKLVEAIATALEKNDLSVWWDRKLATGQAFDREIEEELQKADVALVIWSNTSVASNWVKDEASAAINAKNYFPINISQGAVPLGFRSIHTTTVTTDESLDSAVSAIVEAVLVQINSKKSARPSEILMNKRFIVNSISFAVAGAFAGIAKNYWDIPIEQFLSKYLVSSFEIILLKTFFLVYMIFAVGFGALSGFAICLSIEAFLQKTFGYTDRDKQ